MMSRGWGYNDIHSVSLSEFIPKMLWFEHMLNIRVMRGFPLEREFTSCNNVTGNNKKVKPRTGIYQIIGRLIVPKSLARNGFLCRMWLNAKSPSETHITSNPFWITGQPPYPRLISIASRLHWMPSQFYYATATYKKLPPASSNLSSRAVKAWVGDWMNVGWFTLKTCPRQNKHTKIACTHFPRRSAQYPFARIQLTMMENIAHT